MKYNPRITKDCESVKLVYLIQVKPKQSVQKGTAGKGKGGKEVFFKKTSVVEFEKHLKLLTTPQLKRKMKRKLSGPIAFIATYCFKLPKSYPKWMKDAVKDGKMVYKETKPDLTDNINKAFIDVVAPEIMFDDSRIAHANIKKIYGEEPYIKVEFKELPNPI